MIRIVTGRKVEVLRSSVMVVVRCRAGRDQAVPSDRQRILLSSQVFQTI